MSGMACFIFNGIQNILKGGKSMSSQSWKDIIVILSADDSGRVRKVTKKVNDHMWMYFPTKAKRLSQWSICVVWQRKRFRGTGEE